MHTISWVQSTIVTNALCVHNAHIEFSRFWIQIYFQNGPKDVTGRPDIFLTSDLGFQGNLKKNKQQIYNS